MPRVHQAPGHRCQPQAHAEDPRPDRAGHRHRHLPVRRLLPRQRAGREVRRQGRIAGCLSGAADGGRACSGHAAVPHLHRGLVHPVAAQLAQVPCRHRSLDHRPPPHSPSGRHPRRHDHQNRPPPHARRDRQAQGPRWQRDPQRQGQRQAGRLATGRPAHQPHLELALMLAHRRVLHRGGLAKYAAAFFRKAFSSSSRASSRFSRACSDCITRRASAS